MIEFSIQVGLHKLNVCGLQGTYLRDESGKVSIVSVSAKEPGKGHFSSFLNAFPLNETIEFDNVVSGILRGAVERRGFVDHTGREDWIRYALSNETTSGNTSSDNA